MRLLLDVHLSPRWIGTPLRQLGHDVRSAGEKRPLDQYTDEELLRLAAAEGRIMVTRNVRDFARIAHEWAQAGRGHAGCALVVGIDHSEFGLIVRRLNEALDERPNPSDWVGYTTLVSRGA